MDIKKIFRVTGCLGLLVFSSGCATLENKIISPLVYKTERVFYDSMLSSEEKEQIEKLRINLEGNIMKYRELKDSNTEEAEKYLHLAVQGSMALKEYDYLREVFRDVNDNDNIDEITYKAVFIELMKKKYFQGINEEIKTMMKEKADELLKRGNYNGAFFRHVVLRDYFEMHKDIWKTASDGYEVGSANEKNLFYGLKMGEIHYDLLSNKKNPYIEEYIEMREKELGLDKK